VLSSLVLKSTIAHLASGWILEAINSASDLGAVETCTFIGEYPMSQMHCSTCLTVVFWDVTSIMSQGICMYVRNITYAAQVVAQPGCHGR
jgi:hypothetical protein